MISKYKFPQNFLPCNKARYTVTLRIKWHHHANFQQAQMFLMYAEEEEAEEEEAEETYM